MRCTLLLTLVLALAGCDRHFEPPRPPPFDGGALLPPLLPVSVPCTDAGACASGLCLDGVCCERACAPDESCNEPRQAGHCVARTLGEACDAGTACPSSFCVQGVCCESACAQTCFQCDALPGRCTAVPESQDPRGDCGSGCEGCFSGVCGPAEVGTDPHGVCADGLACGLEQTCGVVDGGACATSDACAAGRCIDSRCWGVDLEDLSPLLNPAATYRAVGDLSANAEGDEAVLLTELVEQDDGATLVEDAALLAFHRSGSAWQVIPLIDLANTPLYETPATVESLGRDPYVALYRPPFGDGTCAADGCGIVGFFVREGGAIRGTEPIALSARGVDAIDTYVQTDGTLVLAYSDPDGFHLTRRRSSDGGAPTWSVPTTIAQPQLYAAGTMVLGRDEGQPLFLAVLGDDPDFADGITALSADGTVAGTLYASDGGLPCDDFNFMAVRTEQSGAGAGPARIGLTCGHDGNSRRSLVGTVDLGDAGARWALEILGENLSFAVPLAGADALTASASVFPASVVAPQVAWRAADGGWAFDPTFRLSTSDALAALNATVGRDGLPLFGISMRSSSDLSTEAARAFYVARYHR